MWLGFGTGKYFKDDIMGLVFSHFTTRDKVMLPWQHAAAFTCHICDQSSPW